MHTQGSIFHHKNLVFHNGFTGIKYLILLNTPGKNEPYLFVKTTSQRKKKATKPGCMKKESLYFIPAGKTFFPLDTWVQLYELYPIPPKDIKTDKNISIVGTLDFKQTKDIIDCLFKAESENIAPVIQKLLRPPLHESLLKLKAKYDNKG